ncbi:MAG: hypothetical protein HY859_18555 [Caulobacterales bacterium]|nr:hypothetical protein [Caulobacterales bacterium]
MRRIAALSVTAFLLAACSPEAPGGGEAAPPADAPATPAAPATEIPAEFAGDFSAAGNEPFWRVDIKGQAIVLSGPAAENVQTTTAANAGLATTADSATWTAQAGTTPVVVKVTRGDCSDGMSDLTYPYKAEVNWGAETLKGCGFETAKQPKEGQ